MAIKRKILMVQQSISVSEAMKLRLESDGYDVIIAYTGKEAKEMAESHCPDLVLLDLALPDVDSVSFVKELHGWSQAPVIVMSTSEDVQFMTDALDNGADDFILKPFSISELLSRIRVVLRNSIHDGSNAENIRSNKLTVGSLLIDYDQYRVFISGEDAHLTQNEFKMVALLGKNAGRVITYEYLMTQLWGPNVQMDNQILRVNMANIRRKIESDTAHPRYIMTVSGVGYRMAME